MNSAVVLNRAFDDAFSMMFSALAKGVGKPSQEPGLVDILAAEKKPKAKQYYHFVNCIGDNCGESIRGKCRRGIYEMPFFKEPQEYPADGKCLYPSFDVYDADLDRLGAYEMEVVR